MIGHHIVWPEPHGMLSQIPVKRHASAVGIGGFDALDYIGDAVSVGVSDPVVFPASDKNAGGWRVALRSKADVEFENIFRVDSGAEPVRHGHEREVLRFGAKLFPGMLGI